MLDATVLNGTTGYSSAATVSADAGTGAVIVSATPWNGGAIAEPGAPAQVDFVHFEDAKTKPPPKTGPLPEPGQASGCTEAPALELTKLVEYKGSIGERLAIDTTDLHAPDVELT